MPGNQELQMPFVYAWPGTEQALTECLTIKPAWMQGDNGAGVARPALSFYVIEPGRL